MISVSMLGVSKAKAAPNAYVPASHSLQPAVCTFAAILVSPVPKESHNLSDRGKQRAWWEREAMYCFGLLFSFTKPSVSTFQCCVFPFESP